MWTGDTKPGDLEAAVPIAACVLPPIAVSAPGAGAVIVRDVGGKVISGEHLSCPALQTRRGTSRPRAHSSHAVPYRGSRAPPIAGNGSTGFPPSARASRGRPPRPFRTAALAVSKPPGHSRHPGRFSSSGMVRRFCSCRCYSLMNGDACSPRRTRQVL